jgi:hypothetical protein
MDDQRIKTYEHIRNVQSLLTGVISELLKRSNEHDRSKLLEPEVDIFSALTPKLEGLTYGTEEYNRIRSELGPALEHHYKNNPHHPEYHKDGIKGMSLVDLLEMICDWQAATLRHSDGNINRSLDLNQKRFGYSDELKEILKNTVAQLNILSPRI